MCQWVTKATVWQNSSFQTSTHWWVLLELERPPGMLEVSLCRAEPPPQFPERRVLQALSSLSITGGGCSWHTWGSCPIEAKVLSGLGDVFALSCSRLPHLSTLTGAVRALIFMSPTHTTRALKWHFYYRGPSDIYTPLELYSVVYILPGFWELVLSGGRPSGQGALGYRWPAIVVTMECSILSYAKACGNVRKGKAEKQHVYIPSRRFKI